MFLAFVILPVFMAAYYGFFKWKGFGVWTNFVGFQNYITIFTDQNFLDALRHNGFILVMSPIMQGLRRSPSPCCSTRTSRVAR